MEIFFMANINFFPREILENIFSFLGLEDLLITRLVCRKWMEVSSFILVDKVAITIIDDISFATEIFANSTPCYKHWVFKKVDLDLKSPFALHWKNYFDSIETLELNEVEISNNDLISLLLHCCNLKQLNLSSLNHIFMTGTFLENSKDRESLKKSLRNIKYLHISGSRYLTDLLFSKIVSIVASLEYLSLPSCQISYQNSIWKRFYPNHISEASDHVFTFKHILSHIEYHKSTLKTLDLSHTTVDSESLIRLSEISGLKLEVLRLAGCGQLTKDGIQLLAQNQKNLIELDISQCDRVTDYGIIAIAENLINLKCLNIRHCQSVTEVGIENLSRLKYLHKLDMGFLPVRKWESIHKALGTVYRSNLIYLNVASLPIQWETVVALSEKAPNLKHLDLSLCNVGVNDKSIQVICKQLTKLEKLSLSGCMALSDVGLSGYNDGGKNVTFLGLGHIGSQLSLESLGLRHKNPYKVPLGSRAEQAIRQEAEVVKYLEENIEQFTHLDDYGLSHLKNLKYLDLCGCLRVTDLSLIYAIRFVELCYLNLSHCQQITEDGLIEVAVNCPSLQELYLTNCPYTSDQVILVISHRLKRLKILEVQKCTLLSNDSLDSLSSCVSLRHLDVSGCDRMTIEAINHLKYRLPYLRKLRHVGIKSQNNDENDPDKIFDVPTPPPLLSKLKKKILWRH